MSFECSMGGGSTAQPSRFSAPSNQPSCTSPSRGIVALTAGSFHGCGSNTLLMDGGVHFVKDSISPSVWSAMGRRADGEVVEDTF